MTHRWSNSCIHDEDKRSRLAAFFEAQHLWKGARQMKMKAYVIFSSREPLLIVARRTIREKEIIDSLRRIGCTKFISREIPIEQVRRRYGRRFEVVEEALQRGRDLRVLDYSGEQVFRSVPFSDYGRAFRCESVLAPE
jgi:hypothetical protein